MKREGVEPEAHSFVVEECWLNLFQYSLESNIFVIMSSFLSVASIESSEICDVVFDGFVLEFEVLMDLTVIRYGRLTPARNVGVNILIFAGYIK